jgi:peptide subunit release factor RF-3
MRILIFVLTSLWVGVVFAQAAKMDPKAREDIAAHRAIAAAHEKAAKCLEAGKAEKECHVHLAIDCKGIAIGKYCGMKHRH